MAWIAVEVWVWGVDRGSHLRHGFVHTGAPLGVFGEGNLPLQPSLPSPQPGTLLTQRMRVA